MRRALVTLALLGCCSCVSDDQWSFAMTRSVYDTEESFEECMPVEELAHTGEGLVVLGGLMLLPVALDIVLLPVTVPRDLIVLGGS